MISLKHVAVSLFVCASVAVAACGGDDTGDSSGGSPSGGSPSGGTSCTCKCACCVAIGDCDTPEALDLISES